MKKIVDDEIRGYTTPAYLKAHTYNLASVDRLTLIVENIGASQTLKYKLLAYANSKTTDTNKAHKYVSEFELAVSSAHEEIISRTAYAKAELYIKDGDGKTQYGITAIKQTDI